MSEQQRNWDKELADIDRAIARSQGSGAPPPAGRAAGPSSAAAPGRAEGGRVAVASTWFRVILGLLLAVGMTQWPYANACGLNLAVYLGAILVVILAGAWSAVSSWRRRLGLAHLLSLLVLLWGLVLAAREVLPRIGYARHARVWTCSSGAVEGP